MSDPLTLYYDDACPRCRRWVCALERLNRHRIRALPLRSTGFAHPSIDKARALQEIPALRSNGQVCYGFSALMAIVSKIWWLWPIYPLIFVLKYTGIGARGYTFFASKRQIQCSAKKNDSTCS